MTEVVTECGLREGRIFFQLLECFIAEAIYRNLNCTVDIFDHRLTCIVVQFFDCVVDCSEWVSFVSEKE